MVTGREKLHKTKVNRFLSNTLFNNDKTIKKKARCTFLEFAGRKGRHISLKMGNFEVD